MSALLPDPAEVVDGHLTADVVVIGAGLAGSEAAWQGAKAGVPVVLHEMRPEKSSPAHHTGQMAELVCSNSLKSLDPTSAAGTLKFELAAMGSFLIGEAAGASIPAGKALAVDRDDFAARVSALVEASPRIEVVRGEVDQIPEAPAIIATALAGRTSYSRCQRAPWFLTQKAKHLPT